MGNSILTLEDFNTVLGLFGASVPNYTFDSIVFNSSTGGKYDFLDVSINGDNFEVEVVNSLFTGDYVVVSGETVSYSDGVFTFPVSQRTKVILVLGEIPSNNLEYSRFVTRPVHVDYVCSMVVKDSEGGVMADANVSIGEYTGVTDSDGEVGITIPANSADIYQYIVNVEDTIYDTLELRRSKIYVDPILENTVLYKESRNNVVFDFGFTGHSMDCELTVNGYKYTATSDTVTGKVEFNVDLTDFTDDTLNYSLKVVADTWVYNKTSNGTINCEYYGVSTFNELVTAYNNGVGTVLLTDDITLTDNLSVRRSFRIIGDGNQLKGHAIYSATNGFLTVENITTDSYSHLVVNNGSITVKDSTFRNVTNSVVGYFSGSNKMITLINCNFINCKSTVLMIVNNNCNVSNCSFIINDLSDWSGEPFIQCNKSLTVSDSYFLINEDESEVKVDEGYLPVFFNLGVNATFNNVSVNQLKNNNSLPVEALTGDIIYTNNTYHFESNIPGKAFTWVIDNVLYNNNVNITEVD